MTTEFEARIASLSTRNREMMQGLQADLLAAIDVPSDYVPASFRRNKNGTVNLAVLAKSHRKVTARQSRQFREKKERQNRVLAYIEQADKGPIEFMEDEDRLYERERLFCKLALRAGWMKPEDFEE